MSWKCYICGGEHANLPRCFGMEAPWREFIPENEFKQRVDLTSDVCFVDDQHFFVRGHIEIPIHDDPKPLAFSVWSSLNKHSMVHMYERWDDPERASDPPYFGWLCSRIPIYPNTLHLKLSVQSRAPGSTPLFTVEPTEHPLALDQHNGITSERWHQIAHQLFHAS